jgi:hypothetical protein
MGGLVARYWLGPMRRWPWCEALITAGTPHRGAPKALDFLVNGPALGAGRLAELREVLRGWPSMHELLPCYPCVQVAPGERAGPHDLELPGIGQAAARRALEVHDEITKAWRDEVPEYSVRDGRGGPQLHTLAGMGHPTLESAWKEGASVVVRDDPAFWIASDTLGGDGTVPTLAARPGEVSGVASLQLTASTHSAIASDDGVIRLLRQISTTVYDAVRGFGEGPRVLGLDMPTLGTAGHPIPVRVQLRGVEASEGAPGRVWLTIRGEDNVTRVVAAERPRHASHWESELGPLTPGIYRVRVEATEMKDPPPPVDEVLAVVGE